MPIEKTSEFMSPPKGTMETLQKHGGEFLKNFLGMFSFMIKTTLEVMGKILGGMWGKKW